MDLRGGVRGDGALRFFLLGLRGERLRGREGGREEDCESVGEEREEVDSGKLGDEGCGQRRAWRVGRGGGEHSKSDTAGPCHLHCEQAKIIFSSVGGCGTCGNSAAEHFPKTAAQIRICGAAHLSRS